MRPLNILKLSRVPKALHLLSPFLKRMPKVRWAFWGEEQRRALPLKIKGNRIFILPTRMGFYWLVAIFVLLVGAMNYNNNMTFLITFIAFGATLVQILETYRGLNGLIIKGYSTRPVFWGETIFVRLVFCTGPKGPITYNVGPMANGEGHGMVTIEGEGEVLLTVPSKKRGLNGIGPIVIEHLGAVGLFRAWSCPHPDIECLVYPRPLHCDLMDTRPLDGESVQAHVMTDPFPSSIRPYVPGDPMRFIHWKASFRGKGLVVKCFEHHDNVQSQGVLLSWYDLRGIGVEERLSILTGCILWCERWNVPYSVRLPGQLIPKGLGPLHMRRALKALALFEA